MRWTKLQSQLYERFADSVKSRVQIHITRYGPGYSHMANRAWITLDGVEIASFSTLSWWLDKSSLASELRSISGSTDYRNPAHKQAYYEAYEQADSIVRQKGNYSRQEFEQTLMDYLSLSIDDAIASQDVLTKALAMLDSRLGKRRLKSMSVEKDHSLIQLFFRLRYEAEGLDLPKENK